LENKEGEKRRGNRWRRDIGRVKREIVDRESEKEWE